MSDETDEQLGMCGVTAEMPTEFVELERQVTGVDWAGVTVTCFEEPHGDEDGHVGLMIRNGSPYGVYCWGGPP
ncbi:hypothetical protein [Streptomyces sp. NPDC050164]|uniref:hypothetical protein n=1 Tax=Streptomyces sp. NPDC050164 TaxID=3365605 RepID=UPI0037B89EAC